MPDSKQDIIRQLRQQILQLQGLGKLTGTDAPDISLGPVLHSFPNRQFPLGVVHEFISQTQVTASASASFVAGISGQLMRKGGACLWISTNRLVHPTGLVSYGVQPDQVIFIDCKSEKQALWATEEALRTEGLGAVISECREVDFTTSRRWQLACEKSNATGFVLRHRPRSLMANASMTRWSIRPIPATSNSNDMPGLDFPHWEVELLKVKNGQGGKWQLQWINGRFESYAPDYHILLPHRRRKAV